MMEIPDHVREQFERIQETADPLAALEPIGAVREWLRTAEIRAIQDARENGGTYSQIATALLTDKQNIHHKVRSAGNSKGLTNSEFDGVNSSTLRYWHQWWQKPERSSEGAEEQGRDPRAEAAIVRVELEAREAAGLLRKPLG
jgi:transposase-like protein